MTHVFKPVDGHEEHAFMRAYCNRCTRSLGGPCDILEAAGRTDDTDPDYPAEWVLEDDGRPACLAFDSRADRRRRQLALCVTTGDRL